MKSSPPQKHGKTRKNMRKSLRMNLINLPVFKDPLAGDLVPIELQEKIPFSVARVYFLKNIPAGITRGAHAHLLEQEVFLCVSGSCTALIDEDGQGKKEIRLDSPQKALFVDTMVWHEFTNFSSDCVLLALSSVPYTPGETNYLTSYAAFQQKHGLP